MTQPRPAFRHVAAPLSVPDADLEKLSDGLAVPSLVTPAAKTPPASPEPLLDASNAQPRTSTSTETPTVKKTAPASKRAPLSTKLSVQVPTYLSDAVNLRAAQERSTARHLVMQGLQAIGFEIQEADLIPDARRPERKRRR